MPFFGGFPNLFFLVGPNTVLAHSSMLWMIESQVTYILDVLTKMKANEYKALLVKRDITDNYYINIFHTMNKKVLLFTSIYLYIHTYH